MVGFIGFDKFADGFNARVLGDDGAIAVYEYVLRYVVYGIEFHDVGVPAFVFAEVGPSHALGLYGVTPLGGIVV